MWQVCEDDGGLHGVLGAIRAVVDVGCVEPSMLLGIKVLRYLLCLCLVGEVAQKVLHDLPVET